MNSILVMTGLGLISAIFLGIAWRFFYVEDDPKLEAIRNILPGLDCGACGCIGCRDAAGKILAGKASVNLCAAGGFEVMSRLSDILKIASPITGPISVVSNCRGGARVENRFFYQGIGSCRAEYLFYGGSKSCENGCLGHGSCMDACFFDAIYLDKSQTPKIIKERCRGCGRCVEACPVGVLSISGLEETLLHMNRSDECLAPCRQRCPAQIDIPRMIHHIRLKEYKTALMTIRERNPLPLSTGRVCAHPCENICRRNIADQGVAIAQLERFLSELPLRQEGYGPETCLPDTGRSVAVIGGGPAGLSCAYFLRRLGHQPVIFEKRNRLGGMLRYGIPEYRLPKRLVDMDIHGILQLGVDVKTRMALGRDFSLHDLKTKGFEAIFLGLGAWQIPALCVDGEYLAQVMKSLDFLSRVGLEIRDLSGVPVVVIGESNTAADCARSCIRLNAASVTLICPVEQGNMSALKRDVIRAMEEGVDILFSTIPTRIISGPDHKVSAIELCRVVPAEKKKKSAGGNKIQGSESVIEAGLIISAYERKPDIDFLFSGQPDGYRFQASSQSTLAADRLTLLASKPDIFAAGDMHTGRASVIEAVAGGRMAARSIHLFLTRHKIPLPRNIQTRINPKSILKDIRVSGHIPKVTVKERDIEVRKNSFVEEVMGTISHDQAAMEASRCLRCGTLCND